jgi:hypothetical protein
MSEENNYKVKQANLVNNAIGVQAILPVHTWLLESKFS